jgi:O-antigen/teichoic acid export membrane protein
MLSARYLGPSNYGLINYAASIVAFALPIMKLGFDATLVYELVESPDQEGEIMGTALLLNTVSGIVCIFGVTSFAAAANPGDMEALLICVLYSLSIFFAALEMIQYWFQYKLLSKYSSVVMLISYIVVSAYKIFLLATGKSVYWFAVSHSVEYAIIGFCLIAIYFFNGGQKLHFSLDRAKQMFSKSKHYILASLMVVVIQNTDHVMLTSMIGKEENGLYSAAITCVTVFQFVYVAIVDSFRPYILSEKKSDQASYERNISRVYSITTYLAIAQGVVFFIFARLIILVLYGSEYLAAASILRILVVYFIFSVMGLVRNIWILAEGKQKYLWIINLTGALINVVLNAVTIPMWNACGAAMASLITQFITNFVLGFVVGVLRPNNKLLVQSLNPKFLLQETKSIVNMLLKPKS